MKDHRYGRGIWAIDAVFLQSPQRFYKPSKIQRVILTHRDTEDYGTAEPKSTESLSQLGFAMSGMFLGCHICFLPTKFG